MHGGWTTWGVALAAALAVTVGTAAAQGPQVGEFFIGVETHAAPDALRTQLNLPEGAGLLVEGVYPGGPAAEAKVQRHDILVRADARLLKDVPDLVAAIEAAQGKKIVVEAVRGGKTLKLEVTPRKRPENLQPYPAAPWGAGPEWNDMMKWIEKVRPGQAGQPPMRFRFFQPGAVLPPDAPATPLPDDVTISVTRAGTKPAKIHVVRGDKTWDVAENELDKLPADLRPHVDRMLGRGAVGFGVAGGGRPLEFVPAPAAPDGPRLEEMKRQMEQLQKSLDDLRRRLPEEK